MCVFVHVCWGKGLLFLFLLFVSVLTPPKLDYIAYTHLDGK